MADQHPLRRRSGIVFGVFILLNWKHWTLQRSSYIHRMRCSEQLQVLRKKVIFVLWVILSYFIVNNRNTYRSIFVRFHQNSCYHVLEYYVCLTLSADGIGIPKNVQIFKEFGERLQKKIAKILPQNHPPISLFVQSIFFGIRNFHVIKWCLRKRSM